MWHRILLERFKHKNLNLQRKELLEKLVNREDVFVNQLNLDCIIFFHSAQIININIVHLLSKKQKNVTVLTVNTHSLIKTCGLRTCW